jgi:hypothetical protein
MPTEKNSGAIDAEVIKEPSLKEILDDKELGRGFKTWLEGQKREDLMVRMLSGKLESDDLKTLASETDKFLERTSQSGEIKKQISETDEISTLVEASNSDDLKDLVKLFGVDGIKEAFGDVLDKIALMPGDELANVYKVFNERREAGKLVEQQKAEFNSMLEKLNLSQEEAKEVAGIPIWEVRQKKVAELWRSKGLEKTEEKSIWFIKWNKKVWPPEQEEFMKMDAEDFSKALKINEWTITEKQIEKAEKALKERQKSLVESLNATASIDGIAELNRHLIGEKEKPDKTMSFKEVKQELKKEKDKENISREFFEYAERGFADYIEEAGYPMGTKDLQMAAASDFYRKFQDNRKLQQNKRGGLWSSIYQTVLEPLVQELLTELQTDDRFNVTTRVEKKRGVADKNWYNLSKKTK